VHSQVGGAKNDVRAAQRELSVHDPSLFYAAVSQHFQIPAQQVQSLVREGLPPAQVVVVYFMAEHSLRQPTVIVRDRLAGKSWRQIAMASGLHPELFYYPLPNAHHAPFVNVYAIYHDLPRTLWTWDRVQLTDSDVENLLNLRFLAELGGRS